MQQPNKRLSADRSLALAVARRTAMVSRRGMNSTPAIPTRRSAGTTPSSTACAYRLKDADARLLAGGYPSAGPGDFTGYNVDDGNQNFRNKGIVSNRVDLLSEFDARHRNLGCASAAPPGTTTLQSQQRQRIGRKQRRHADRPGRQHLRRWHPFAPRPQRRAARRLRLRQGHAGRTAGHRARGPAYAAIWREPVLRRQRHRQCAGPGRPGQAAQRAGRAVQGDPAAGEPGLGPVADAAEVCRSAATTSSSGGRARFPASAATSVPTTPPAPAAAPSGGADQQRRAGLSYACRTMKAEKLRPGRHADQYWSRPASDSNSASTRRSITTRRPTLPGLRARLPPGAPSTVQALCARHPHLRRQRQHRLLGVNVARRSLDAPQRAAGQRSDANFQSRAGVGRFADNSDNSSLRGRQYRARQPVGDLRACRPTRSVQGGVAAGRTGLEPRHQRHQHSARSIPTPRATPPRCAHDLRAGVLPGDDGLDLSVPIGIGYNFDGRSSAIVQLQRRRPHGGDFSIGVKATYQQDWKFGLSYVRLPRRGRHLPEE